MVGSRKYNIYFLHCIGEVALSTVLAHSFAHLLIAFVSCRTVQYTQLYTHKN